MNATKHTGRALSIPGGVGVGTAGAMLWTVLGAGLTALLISKELLPETAIGYSALIILITSGFLTAKISYGRIKHRRAMVMAVSGAVYFLCLLAVNALFFGGQYAGVGVTAGAVLAGTACAVLVGNGGGRTRSHRKYKISKV